MSDYCYVTLVDATGRSTYSGRMCPAPAPIAITYGGKTYINTGEPGWWARTFGPRPFLIYREGYSTWPAGGPLSGGGE